MTRFHKPVLLGFCTGVTRIGDEFQLSTVSLTGEETFPHSRWIGFLRALEVGFVDEVVLFGPPEEGELHRELMVEAGANRRLIDTRSSSPNTHGNVIAMHEYLKNKGLTECDVVYSTSHSHVPRALEKGRSVGLIMPHVYAAESFLLAATRRGSELRKRNESWLVRYYGDSAYVRKVVSEIRGGADTLNNSYV